MRSILTLITLAACCLVTGCPKPAPREGPQPWRGETLTMAEVVQQVNQNNAKIPTLWSEHEFDAYIYDENKREHFVNGNGGLLYRRPDGLLIRGNKPVVGTVFEIGSTGEHYWLTTAAPNQPKTMWWGSFEHIGKECVEGQIPIRPELVLEVLGVGTFNTNFVEPPVPVMRFNPDAHAYMFVWNAPSVRGDRWVAVKEVWYDRETLLPTRVFLFDENGRVVLRAQLAGHAPVRAPDVPEGQWPLVAREYRLYFPDSGSRMRFTLTKVVLEHNGIPRRRGIDFDPDDAEDRAQEVIQIDAACED